jgi:multisubunit Na+/H+ antiporter MnhF subunit
MNAWLWVSAVLLASLVPCLVVAIRASAGDGLIALQLAGTLATSALLSAAEGLGREPLGDLAVVLAVASLAGTMTFVRFVERNRAP